MMFCWGLLLLLGLGGVVYLLLGPSDALRNLDLGRSTRPPQEEEDRALTILRERYARGDISREEYEEKRRALMERGP